MSASTGNSGVRNLRAMFENKGGDTSNSPPSRGRSPSGSVASSTSRPVSKVRASFVAVERSGEQGQLWGLRKASDVSSMAEVAKDNDSGVVDVPPAATMSTPEKNPSDGLGSILKGSSFAGTPKKEESNKMGAIQEKEPSPRKVASTGDDNKQLETNGVGARALAAAKRVQEKAKTSAAKSNPKPIETKAPSISADKKSPRTPTTTGVKPRGGAAKILGVMDSAKKAAEGREATKKADTTTSAKMPATPKSPKQSVRSPRATVAPKSPAKPAKLPSAATAPTAASAAHNRTTAPAPVKQPLHSDRPVRLPSAVTATTTASVAHDRSVPEVQPKKLASRRLSAAQPTTSRLSTASTQASLAKKASRASLADRPKSRTSINKPDEGFLARMMRPTQSSAQKTHEKSQVSSPPRTKPAAPKSNPTSRPSFGSRAHHDHADEKGDYATKSPTSPTAPKNVKNASHGSSTASKPVTQPQPTPEIASIKHDSPKIRSDAPAEALQLTPEEPAVPAKPQPATKPSTEPSSSNPVKTSAKPVESPSDEPPSTDPTSQSLEQAPDSNITEPLELSEKPVDTSEEPSTDVGNKSGFEPRTVVHTAAV